jgi:hypothetical protein
MAYRAKLSDVTARAEVENSAIKSLTIRWLHDSKVASEADGPVNASKGVDNVRAEFSLTALVYNLRRALNILAMMTAVGA